MQLQANQSQRGRVKVQSDALTIIWLILGCSAKWTISESMLSLLLSLSPPHIHKSAPHMCGTAHVRECVLKLTGEWQKPTTRTSNRTRHLCCLESRNLLVSRRDWENQLGGSHDLFHYNVVLVSLYSAAIELGLLLVHNFLLMPLISCSGV